MAKTDAQAKPFGEEIVTRIERIIPGGYGLAHAEGKTLLVSLAAPGDVVRVQIERTRERTLFASVKEVLEPSPQRIEPPCPYFGVCGGCDFQHLAYQTQLKAKLEIIKDCFARIARVGHDLPIDITPAPREFNYRTRAEWQVEKRALKLGYFTRASHQVCDVEVCPVLTQPLQSELTRARQNLNRLGDETKELRAASGDKQALTITLKRRNDASSDVIAQTEVETNEDTSPMEERELTREIRGEIYRFDANCFFQINTDLLPALIDEALRFVDDDLISNNAEALDLYCGVGLFTLPLARRFARVTGIEAHAGAARYGAANLRAANLTGGRIVRRDTASWLRENADELKGNIRFVLLDPPRAGAEQASVASLLQMRPRRIAYVSCDPATLARDVKSLCEAGYKLHRVHALDLFPQTHHVETVAHLTLP